MAGLLLCSPAHFHLNISTAFGISFSMMVNTVHSYLQPPLTQFTFFLGVSFLFRVGLALISCSRRQLLECNNDKQVFRQLNHLVARSLPFPTDAFISFVFSMKLKDDDIRRQRVKMEAQVKRQTQLRSPLMPGSPGGPRSTASISLPRG